MDHLAAIAAVAGLVFGYGLVSRRLSTTTITPPMIFVAAGILLGDRGLGLIEETELNVGTIGILAELTLVLLLFTDAIRIDFGRLRRDAAIPARLLGIGLPLTVFTGTLFGWLLFPELGWAAALVMAAILAPTDAALAQPVLFNPRVPLRIRQTFNVESGLNDGIMVPIITGAVALLAMGEPSHDSGNWALFVGRQIGFGVIAGAIIGSAGGRLLHAFARREWVEGVFRQLSTLSIGLAAFTIAELVGGNGFVAAFTAGLGFGLAARDSCQGAYDFAEDEGVLLALLTFLAFGMTIAGPVLGSLTPRTIAYAIGSLTVVRMIPVGVALVGSGFRTPTVAFLGWFGPRGLASILFAVFLLEEAGTAPPDLFNAIMGTVLISVLLHGVTAAPLSKRYAAWVERMEDALGLEMAPMPEPPVRARVGQAHGV